MHTLRGTTGIVRRLLPPAPTQPGFWEARFHRGLLVSLTVPNAWWLEHGDRACGLAAWLDVTTPEPFAVIWDTEKLVWRVEGDPAEREFSDDPPPKRLDDVLQWRWPSARFTVDRGCVPGPMPGITIPPGWTAPPPVGENDPFDVADAP